MSGTSLTDTSGERGMVKVMGMVIVSLILLSLFIFSMARLLATGRDDAASDPLMRNALISRIEPVGAVRTSADEIEQVADAGAAMRTGEELVQGVCAGCHVAGAAGAPLLGDADAWAERREQGLDYLVASVVNGKNAMPANGGSDYTEDEIRLAVQHIAMFEDTGETDAAGGDEPLEPSATTMTEAAKEGEAGAEAGDVPSGGQVRPSDEAVEGTAMAADAGSGAAAPVTGEGGSGELAEQAVAEDVGTAAPSADMAPEDLVALVGSGAEPEGLTDDIKAQVDGVCAGCHVAGVAGAPKIGDQAAWTERAELGLAALTQSVIDGKGVMPARGGSTLTDEQVPIAIRYQMGKTAP